MAHDKGNQDFAFHLEISGPRGAPWVLCGVADGVGQATWSARAARHAAGGFIEAVQDFFGDADFPHSEADLLGERWFAPLARLIHGRIGARIERDTSLLCEGRYVDPTWAPRAFAAMFQEDPNAASRIRQKWFQTTLLAAALGPYGGFALFLGDGFVRVDREFSDGRWESSPGLDPTLPISMDLSEALVRAGLTRLLPRGAHRIGVLLTTDGVSNSTKPALERAIEGCATMRGLEHQPPLERVLFSTSAECEKVLSRLAELPPELADRDNMSIAFGQCELMLGEGS